MLICMLTSMRSYYKAISLLLILIKLSLILNTYKNKESNDVI